MGKVLGVDFGGTKVLAGVIDTDSGEVLGTKKERSRAGHTSTDLLQHVVDAANGAIEDAKVSRSQLQAAGVGVAGQIDRKRGVVLNAPNLAGMKDVALAEILSKELRLPVYLYNDVEAAAAGEAAFGAGKGESDFVVMFVGTGIGGAIYRNGKPYTGATHTAGEVGHIVVDVNGRLCGCGGTGHLEAYASRTAIVRVILGQLKNGRKSVLRDEVESIDPNDPGGSGIRSKKIKEALEDDDDLVREALLTAAQYLAAGFVSIINFYNPPLIIVGGGLIDAVDLYFDAARRAARQHALQVPRGDISIVKAALGDNSGIVGAAVLAGARG